MIEIRHRNIDLIWCGFPHLYKVDGFYPLKLSYNGTAGWWIDRKIFLSYNQLKKKIKELKWQTGHRQILTE